MTDLSQSNSRPRTPAGDQITCPRCGQRVFIKWKNPTKKDDREGWQIRVHQDDIARDRCPTSMMIVEDAERWVAETRARLGLAVTS